MRYRLSDCVDIISGGTPKKSISEYWNGNIPWITIRDFNSKYPKTVNEYITEEGLEHSAAKLSENKDILISARGTVGEVMMVHAGYTFNQSIYGLRVKKDIAISEYIYYWLVANKEIFAKNVHGSVFDTITRKTFDHIQIELPNIADQLVIVHKLNSIDSKIMINEAINTNLEKISTEFFHNWLSNTHSDKKKSLDSIANYKNGLAMQKFRPINIKESLPVVKIRELNQGHTDSNSDLCRKDIDESVQINTGDIIFSWSGTLLLDLWAGNEAGLNQHLFKVTSNDYPSWFIYEWTKYYLQEFQLIAKSKATTMGHIKRSNLKESFAIIPDDNEWTKLNNLLGPIFDNKIKIRKQNLILRQIKNQLLAKLLN